MLGEVHFEHKPDKIVLNSSQLESLKNMTRRMKHKETSFENTGQAITVELEKDFMIVDGNNISFTSYCLHDAHKNVWHFLNKLT